MMQCLHVLSTEHSQCWNKQWSKQNNIADLWGGADVNLIYSHILSIPILYLELTMNGWNQALFPLPKWIHYFEKSGHRLRHLQFCTNCVVKKNNMFGLCSCMRDIFQEGHKLQPCTHACQSVQNKHSFHVFSVYSTSLTWLPLLLPCVSVLGTICFVCPYL